MSTTSAAIVAVSFIAGVIIGAVTLCTIHGAMVDWLDRRAEQRRKDKGRWLKDEQEKIGRMITRMK